MNAHAVLSIGRRCIAAAGVALALPLSALATESVPYGALSVKVFPDVYVAGGRSFTTVAALEAWVAGLEAWSIPSEVRSLQLDGCGPGSTGQLITAVQWLYEAHADAVRIRTFAAGDPACVEAAAQAKPGHAITPLPYYEGDRSGRSAVH